MTNEQESQPKPKAKTLRQYLKIHFCKDQMTVQMQYRGIKHDLNKKVARTEKTLVYRGARYIRQAITEPANEAAASQTVA